MIWRAVGRIIFEIIGMWYSLRAVQDITWGTIPASAFFPGLSIQDRLAARRLAAYEDHTRRAANR